MHSWRAISSAHRSSCFIVQVQSDFRIVSLSMSSLPPFDDRLNHTFIDGLLSEKTGRCYRYERVGRSFPRRITSSQTDLLTSYTVYRTVRYVANGWCRPSCVITHSCLALQATASKTARSSTVFCPFQCLAHEWIPTGSIDRMNGFFTGPQQHV